MKALILFASIFFNLQSVLAFPNRPASAACRDLVPVHGGTPQNLGFQLVAAEGGSFTPGGPSVEVTLIGNLQYRGIFLQVRDGSSLQTSSAVGSWEESVTPNLFGIVDCSFVGFPPNSALGHTNRQLKRANQGFRWTPPDDCSDGQTFTVRASVVVSMLRYQTGLELRLRCANPTPESITNATRQPSPLPPVTLAPQTTPPPTQVPQTLPPTTPPPVPTKPSQTTETNSRPIATPVPPPLPPLRGCQFSAFDNIPSEYTNNFENSSDVFQGWRPLSSPSNSSFQWTPGRGPTPSIATGPGEAFEGDNYIFTEGSSPAQPGDRAVFETREDLRGCFCFRFAYSFDITGEGHTLSVVIGNVELGTLRNRSLNWRNTEIPVDTPDFVQIQIIATRGPNWLGDIGLDNVRLEPGRC